MPRAESQSARMSKITGEGRLNPVWHRMLYSCTLMATVGIKGLLAYVPRVLVINVAYILHA